MSAGDASSRQEPVQDDNQGLDLDVAHHGISEHYTVSDAIDEVVEEIFFLGYSVVEHVLSAEEVESARSAIDRVYLAQMEELGGEEMACRIQDANHIRCPLAYDDVFVGIARHPTLVAILERLFGDNFVLLMQNAIINPPGEQHYQTRWHRDLNHQHWASSKILAANALFCIDPFVVDNGATHVLPATHLRESFPSSGFVRKHQVPVQAPAGSLIIMDAMLYHRAGRNESSSPRRALNHVIGRPFMAQQIDIPAFVGDRLATDDLGRRYFGYRWQAKPSAKSWRLSKLPRE